MAWTSRLTPVIIFLILLLNLVSLSSCRKLLEVQELESIIMAPPKPPLDIAREFLTALPKGKVPASTPSNKGHSFTIDEKMIARHLAELDRILQSVPSPGVGH